MRFLKPLLLALGAVIALFAGLLTAAIVAVTAIAVFLTRRLFRPKSAGAPSPSAARHASRHSASDPEAIDVIATEVPADRLPR